MNGRETLFCVLFEQSKSTSRRFKQSWLEQRLSSAEEKGATVLDYFFAQMDGLVRVYDRFPGQFPLILSTEVLKILSFCRRRMFLFYFYFNTPVD